MPPKAAGILLYRIRKDELEVLLVHPGGPYYKRIDDGIWSIPKGLYEPGEDPLDAARREFNEETGGTVSGPYKLLPEVKYSSGKRLTVYACKGEFELEQFKSNSFELEWPPGSGILQAFPEADRAGWFNIENAKQKILSAQVPLLEDLIRVADL